MVQQSVTDVPRGRLWASRWTARVDAVLLDVDDERHVAVVLDDDPGADLHEGYGRYHYFAPAELTPLDAEVGRT